MSLRRLRHPVVIAIVVLGAVHGTLFAVHKHVTAVGHYVRAHHIFNGAPSPIPPDYATEFTAAAGCIGPAGGENANNAPIVFDYYTAATEVINDGRALRIKMQRGSLLTVAGVDYQLAEIDLLPVPGKPDDLVAHLIHRSDDGRRVVLALSLRKGQANPALAKLREYLPLKQGDHNALSDVRVDPNDLLPADHTYYRYATTCGTTQWLALTTPAQMSPAQLATYDGLYTGQTVALHDMGTTTVN